MKILMLSLSQDIFRDHSDTLFRLLGYSKRVESLTVIVPYNQKRFSKPVNNFELIGSGGKNKIIQFWEIFRLIKEKQRDSNWDLITVQDTYYLAFLAWFFSWKYKIPLEVQVHGFEKWFGLRKIIGKFVIKRANIIRVVSHRLSQVLVDEFRVNKDIIYICPLSLLEIKTKPIKQRLKEDFVFLSVCRLVRVKRLDLLILAFNEIANKYPRVKLWLVGDGSERIKLEKQVRTLGLNESVKFFGWQKDVEYFYDQADIFVLSSDSEGWGMTVLEAVMNGLPVIMTDVGLAGEVFTENEVMIIKPGDKSALVMAMSKALADYNSLLSKTEQAQEKLKVLPELEIEVETCFLNWQKAVNNKK